MAAVLGTSTASAQSACDQAAKTVAWSAAIGAGSGAAAAVGTSAIVSVADSTRDYDFGTGALAGAGVAVGLAGLYAIVDATSGCRMAESGFGWSIPITTVVVGSAIPIALWGASDKVEPVGTATESLVSLGWRF